MQETKKYGFPMLFSNAADCCLFPKPDSAAVFKTLMKATERNFKWMVFPANAAWLAGTLLLLSGGRSLCAVAVERADFFTASSPIEIEIAIATNLFASLNKTNRQYVPGEISVGGSRLERVGFRLKGWSSFQPIQLKPSFAVKFNAFLPEQRLRGLSKLILNNCRQDTSCLRESLANSLFRDAGIPAPRTRLARVSLNGRDLGTYVAIEAMNKDFLRRNFGDASGNLYEGFNQDIGPGLELDSGTDHTHADVEALRNAAGQPEPDLRWHTVGVLLDTERFLRYAALNMLLGAQDGYLFNGNNYRLYHDPVSRKFVFIPHGLDSTFVCGRPLDPPMGFLLPKGLLSCRPGQQSYRSNLWHLATNLWDVAQITNRIAEGVRQLIALSKTEAERANRIEHGEILSGQVMTRRQEVLAALTQPAVVNAEFGTSGRAALTNWFPAGFVNSPRFEAVTNANGVFLQIDAPRSAVGSWRTRVSVPEGEYIFSGRGRTLGKPQGDGISTTMARVAIAGHSIVQGPIPAGSEWRDLSLNFSVPQGGGTIDVICEHTAGAGVTVFDLQSLQMRRR
jgi:hypothetical protein